MVKAYISPRRYVQGPGEMKRIGAYASCVGGSKFLVVISPSGAERFYETIKSSIESARLLSVLATFGGESTQAEVDRVVSLMKDSGADAVIGVGGGKALDTAKAAADIAGVPVVIVPTVASSDAPCSSLAVIYKESGAFDHLMLLRSNPELVLVDSEVIAHAPARMLAAGMGDALATYFESRAAALSGAVAIAGGRVTQAASAIAKQCYETLLKDGVDALKQVNEHRVGNALENVIEANILLSGIGFESGGTAAAHPIGNGLTELPACHHLYHGEKVAFATLVQLRLEDAPDEVYDEVYKFLRSVGLPVSYEELGLNPPTEDDFKTIARLATAPEESMKNMPFPVTEAMVIDALRKMDVA